jgi:hypothetical protein
MNMQGTTAPPWDIIMSTHQQRLPSGAINKRRYRAS